MGIPRRQARCSQPTGIFSLVSKDIHLHKAGGFGILRRVCLGAHGSTHRFEQYIDRLHWPRYVTKAIGFGPWLVQYDTKTRQIQTQRFSALGSRGRLLGWLGWRHSQMFGKMIPSEVPRPY